MENSAPLQTPSPPPLENDLPKLNPTATANTSSRNTIHIGGIPVEFPYPPYGSQLAYMNRVISTLDRSARDGHCHALLESPTGTGKSLSLLCSTLAWQQTHKLKNIRANLTHSSSRPDPRAVSDPINHGGGFIPETQPSGNPAAPPPSTNNGKKEKVRLAPTIYYSSRTHAQISQVIREYKKTSYRVLMAVLGSRKHYCTNPHLRGDEKVDEQCKLLLKNKENACPEFKHVHKVKGHPSLQKGGCHEVHDIEDLVKVGQVVKGCSYFAARSMAQEAELVFCPYNYIINPVIREAMEVDISQSIIILDEAHNIEDIARDAGSINLDEEVLIFLQTELGQLSLNDSMTYQPLFEMIEDILSWIGQRKDGLVKRQFQCYFRCWSGDKALKELQEANVSLQSFPILQECAKKAIKAASEAEPDVPYLSGMSSTTLEGLFSSLNYFFSGKGIHVHDFELALQKSAKKDGGWTTTFSLWCLNPAVVFKGIADSSQSVILTSGTLSPLNTFSSELGVQFDTCLEAPHVIDVDSQVWVAAISKGPGNYPLNASYKFSDEYAFQDAIGTSLEEICKVAPGGCLVFFPSYKLLDKVSTRWQETGQWSRLSAQKSFFVEPRGSSQESFDDVLKGYYKSIRHGTKPVGGRKVRSKKLGLKSGSLKVSIEDTKIEGAAFLAVCRGKVSEGIDFSDDNARVVVIVGIPFPNIYDVKVERKKKFNDTYETSKNLLSGNEWYCQQAFRALNQATGRCIRHRFDYGAIIFLDERFHKDRNRSYISKWLRKSIRLYGSFEESMDGLKSFFKEVKVHPGISVAANSQQDLEIDCVNNIKSVDKKKAATKRNIKTTKSNSCPKKVASDDILVSDSPFTSKTKTRNEVVMLKGDKGAAGVRQEYIDLDCDSENDSGCCRSPPASMVGLQSDDLELTIVKETPDLSCRYMHHSPTFTRLKVATPENLITSKTNSVITEPESCWSVNSNAGKRRKIPALSSVSHLHEFGTPIKIHDRLASSITAEESNHLEKEHLKPHSILSPTHVPCGDNTDESLQISCLNCKNPLGLPENDLLVKSSLISTSKAHLISLQKKSSESAVSCTSSVDILVSDASLVNQRVIGTSGEGVWCKEDGCVYNSVFCPFCVVPENCIGVHVMATDASNVKFQNKILFYRENLDIKRFEAEIQNFGAKYEVLSSHGDSHLSIVENKNQNVFEKLAYASPVQDSSIVENKSRNVFEKFAYTSPVEDSGGWRNTRRSRMRLPKIASTQK